MRSVLTPAEIRSLFLNFFESKKHRIVGSAPLVPRLDPTILFTNAGMNQFKGVFTGQEKRDYVRATSSQKCVRAGGKHNDLENVGRTARHHTFFEMLGNFSFGDYFKKDAIAFAWEFVTVYLKLPKDRLYISVYKDDQEAFDLWNHEIGIEASRIFRFGEKDNFWAMGETGPCGPCSEIFFDQGKGVGCGKSTCTVGCECDRYLEFWNLVFMEFEQRSDGTRVKLPKPSIDTGMGLERISAIVAGVTSNYDTELFTPLLNDVAKRSGKTYTSASEEEKVSMRVVADHLRATSFLIADGVIPSNEGRGYVLRRIMRRAMRHGRKLGLHKPFLFEMHSVLQGIMGAQYSELSAQNSIVVQTIESEEKKFSETIDKGLELLGAEIQSLRARKQTVFAGDVAFRLYETYGFPIDLTADILREEGLTYDQTGFDLSAESHREKARGSWKGSGAKNLDQWVRRWLDQGLRTTFLGYDMLLAQGKVVALLRNGNESQSATEGEEIELVANETPFYGEGGGQVGDIGSISSEKFSLRVLNTLKPSPDLLIHQCQVTGGTINVGDVATFEVDRIARESTAKNHTATHILHATLKEVLGDHVKQAGSWVAPERLRFDFIHSKALTELELQKIERTMNERIWADTPVAKEVMPIDQALNSGAIALFDEKYGDRVRVITVGSYSKELCGGTHLARTGEIGIFKIAKESSVASGVRRLEAITGYGALKQMQDMDSRLRSLSTVLGTSSEELSERVLKLLDRQKELEKDLKKRKVSGGSSEGDTKEIHGIMFYSALLTDLDPRSLREVADRELEKIKSGVVAIGTQAEGKAFAVVKVSKDLSKKFDAGKLIQAAAKILGGSGGGRAEMAQAGGPNTTELKAALAAIGQSLA